LFIYESELSAAGFQLPVQARLNLKFKQRRESEPENLGEIAFWLVPVLQKEII
jgi:hypothetical protein